MRRGGGDGQTCGVAAAAQSERIKEVGRDGRVGGGGGDGGGGGGCCV